MNEIYMQTNYLNSPSQFEITQLDALSDTIEPQPVEGSTPLQSLPSEIFELVFSFTSSHDKETLVQVNKFWAKSVVDQTKVELRNSLQKATALLVTHLPMECNVKASLIHLSLHTAFELCKNLNDLKIDMRRWNKTIITKLSALALVDIFKLKNTLPKEISLPFCNDLIEDAEIKSLEHNLGNYSAPYYGPLFSDWKEDYFNMAIATGRYKMMLYLKQDSIQSPIRMTQNQPLPLFLRATNQFDKLLRASNSLPSVEKEIVKTFANIQRDQVDPALLPYDTIDQLSLQSQEIVASLDGDDLKEILTKDVEAQIELARLEFARISLCPDVKK